MSSSGREAVPDLVAALEAALRSWEIQSEDLRALRNRTLESDQRFAALLQARASGDAAPPAWKPAFSAEEVFETSARSSQLTREWREGLLGAWQALMRGYAEPELRPGLEQIADLLHRLDLLQLAAAAPAAPPELPTFSPPSPSEDPEERRRQRASLAQSVMASMRESFAETDRRLQETARDTEALLRQALAAARALPR